MKLNRFIKIIIMIFAGIGVIVTGFIFITPLVLLVINFSKNHWSVDYVIFVLGLPFVAIAWPIGIYKSIKTRTRFNGAIKHVPNWMRVLFYVFLVTVLLFAVITSNPIGIFPLFDYTAFLIFLSLFIEKKQDLKR